MNERIKWPGGSVGRGIPAFNTANLAFIEVSNKAYEQAVARYRAMGFEADEARAKARNEMEEAKPASTLGAR